MIILFKALLRTLVLPPAGLLILIAVGVWLLRRSTGTVARRVGWVLVTGAVAALWLLSTPVVADTLSRLTQHYPALDLDQPVDAQAIVILGGGESRGYAPEYRGPAAGTELLQRLAYGAYVARRTGLPVLVTGRAPEAIAMRASLAREFGIRTRWLEGLARDTFENAQFSARMLKPAGISRIVLVTTSNHEWRAAHEFEAAGFQVVPAPVEVWAAHTGGLMWYVPTSLALLHSTEVVYETIGELVRRALAATHLRRQNP